nr:hypothetical protein [uncultured Desulfobacter sp.]
MIRANSPMTFLLNFLFDEYSYLPGRHEFLFGQVDEIMNNKTPGLHQPLAKN